MNNYRAIIPPTRRFPVRSALATVIIGLCLISVCSFTSCTYVRQGEKAFFYNVSSRRPVNPQDNPLLSMGFHATWGPNQKLFSVLGTIMDYEFTGQGSGSATQFVRAKH